VSSATTPAAHPAPLGPYERLALAALAGLGLLACAVWTWGGVAGVVFGSGWPPGGLGDQVAVLGRLPHHLADPAQAWPRPRRAGLPGPAGFYAALVLLLAAAIAVGLAGLRALKWARAVFAGDASRAAKWASSADVRELAVRSAQPGRVTLGRVTGRLVAAEPLQSAIALAPTQSRKTSGLAVPAILEWPGPVRASRPTSSATRWVFAASSGKRRSSIPWP
jgi:type IV secretion system protein VirD4